MNGPSFAESETSLLYNQDSRWFEVWQRRRIYLSI